MAHIADFLRECGQGHFDGELMPFVCNSCLEEMRVLDGPGTELGIGSSRVGDTIAIIVLS